MEELAPKAIGVAAGFGATGEMGVRGHVLVVASVASGRVLIAVAHVEDFESRIGKRLTAGTPGTSDDRTIGQVLGHDSGSFGTRRRNPSAITLTVTAGFAEEIIHRHNGGGGVDDPGRTTAWR
jgi:hypothetical protein